MNPKSKERANFIILYKVRNFSICAIFLPCGCDGLVSKSRRAFHNNSAESLAVHMACGNLSYLFTILNNGRT